MPKISVIIPTCNRARFLRAAVESVLQQTFQDFEIIVVDDASTDETPALMSGFADRRIRYLRHESKQGQGATRNAGIRAARGEYVALLDDDDEWLPSKLAKQAALLDGLPPQVGLIYTGFVRIDAESKTVVAEVMPTERGDVSRALCGGNRIGTCSTVLMRRSCFDKAGYFDETLASGADYDMWLRISRFYHFEFVNEPLVRYTMHPKQLSADLRTILKGKEAQLEKHADHFARDRRSYSRRLFTLGVLYCYNRKPAEGRAALWRAIRAYPLELRPYFNLFLALWGCDNFIRLKAFKDRLRRSLSFAHRP